MSTSKLHTWRIGLCSVSSWLALLVIGTGPVLAQGPGSAQRPAQAPASLPPDQGPAAASHDLDPVFHVVASDTKLSIIQLQSRTLQFSKRIEVVDGHNPEILNVTPVSPTQIRVRAETTGVTAMTVKDESGAIFTLEIFVEGDVRELKAYLVRLFPGSAIDVVSLRDSIVLRGWVTDPTTIPQIMAIAKQMYPTVHNQMQVGGVSVVQLHVKILEVQRSKLKKLGINFVASGQRYGIANTIGGLTSAAFTAPFGAPPVPAVGASSASNLQFAITGTSDRFQGFVEALTQEALAKVLAEPTLVTTSGRPASLLSGGEFPILVPGGVGTVTIQFREFGVRMEAIPTVLGNGRLRLDVAPEVSERDFSSAVTVGGVVVPGINTRRVNTQVEMNFGETIMIGGLISRRRATTSSKVPILGEIPVIGAAFSRKSHEIGETELLIMVTPEMAGAMRPDQVPHDAPGWTQDEPTGHELFLDGMLEVPGYGPDCDGCQNGVGCGVPHGQGMPGMISSSSANCAPSQEAPRPTSNLPTPEKQELLVPQDPPVGEIQTMSGRADRQQVIKAGGDPFRASLRREIPETSTRPPKTGSPGPTSSGHSSPKSGTSESRPRPGVSGPPSADAARPKPSVQSRLRGLSP